MSKLTGSDREPTGQVARLFADVSELINSAKNYVFDEANKAVAILNWHIGNKINNEILKDERAKYGKNIAKELGVKLTMQFGKGYTKDALLRMVGVVKKFPDFEIFKHLAQQLRWSHFVEIRIIDDPLKREFYAELCRVERWTVRELRNKIATMVYERTAIAKKPEKVIAQEIQRLRDTRELTADFVFRDPYTLDFLEIDRPYSEKELEQAILNDIEKFLLEMGHDFAFLARQKRITVDGVDYWMDLLMFHRKLHCMIVVELKIGKFMAADKGQLELYLRWLEQHEMQPGEKPPIGLVMCSEKSTTHVELLQLEGSGIKVSQFLTELPPKQILESKLQSTIREARERYDSSDEGSL